MEDQRQSPTPKGWLTARDKATRCLGATLKTPTAPTAALADQLLGSPPTQTTQNIQPQQATMPDHTSCWSDYPGPGRETMQDNPQHQPQPQQTKYWAPGTHK